MSARNLIWLVLIILLAGLSLYLAGKRPARVDMTDPTVTDLGGVLEAYKLLNRHGYQVTPPARATQGAIEGMVRAADEFSFYVPPDQAGAFDQRVSGTAFETGLRVRRRGERIVVVGAMPESPADKAGLHEGMEVLTIGDSDAADLTIAQARQMLLAADGAKVKLRLLDRDGRQFRRTLRPARFELRTVTGIARDDDGQWSYILDERANIGYIRIGEFVVRRTSEELFDAYHRLGRPRGLILDLRGNPGGTLTAGVEVADRFLARGMIARTESRTEKPHTYYAHSEGTFPLVPTVALIDGQTASAAELVAGSLQAHGRAVLLGQPSFGKRCVQNTFDLGGNLGLVHLTTAKFVLGPHPGSPEAAPATATAPTTAVEAGPPLRPDVPVKLTGRAAQRLERLRLQIEVVPPPAPATAPATGPAKRTDMRAAILRLDTQLAQALELLRADRIVTTRPAGAPPLATLPADERPPPPAPGGQP